MQIRRDVSVRNAKSIFMAVAINKRIQAAALRVKLAVA